MLKLQLTKTSESIWLEIEDNEWEISPEAFSQLCIGLEKFEASSDSSKIIYLDLADEDFDEEEE